MTRLEEQRGDTVSMSKVVVKSTENGPNLVIVDGKVVQAVPVWWVHIDAILRWLSQEEWFHRASARSQGPVE